MNQSLQNNAPACVILGSRVFFAKVLKVNKKTVKVEVPNQPGKSQCIENVDFSKVVHQDKPVAVVLDLFKGQKNSHYFDEKTYRSFNKPAKEWVGEHNFVIKN